MKRHISLLTGIVLLILLSGCSSASTPSNIQNQSSVHREPTPISFVNDKKQRIWFVLDAHDFDKSGKSVVPSQIIVTKSDKATVYNTGGDYNVPKYYKNYLRVRKNIHILTIGDYSKMSDKQIITQAGTIDKNSYDLLTAFYTDRNSDPAIGYHSNKFIKYSAPVSHPMKVVLYTDRTGNDVTAEKVTLTNAFRVQVTDGRVDHNLDLSYKFNRITDKLETIYQSNYYGYSFIDSSNSDKNAYYLTRTSNTPAVTFDSTKTPGATLK